MTRVPLASRVVGGLVNLRGHIVTAIDLRRCLDLSERSAGASPVNVILRPADGGVSLLVDRVGDVWTSPATGSMCPPHTLMRGRARIDPRRARTRRPATARAEHRTLVNGIVHRQSGQPGDIRLPLESSRTFASMGSSVMTIIRESASC